MSQPCDFRIDRDGNTCGESSENFFMDESWTNFGVRSFCSNHKHFYDTFTQITEDEYLTAMVLEK